MSLNRLIWTGYVLDTRTNGNPVETYKNEGENANEFTAGQYEQILTERQRFGIIFHVRALCPFPTAL